MDINDVLSLPDLHHSFVTGAWTEILVDGDGDEFVQSTGQGWSYLGTAVVDSATYDYYGHFGLNAGLLVDDNITAPIIN